MAGGNTLVPNEDGSFSLKIDEATAVAKVDGVGYTTLQAAVDALGCVAEQDRFSHVNYQHS